MSSIQNNEIRIDLILRKILDKKSLFIKNLIYSILIGLIAAFLIKPEYTATTVFTPNFSKSTNISSSGIGGLAAMAGINLDKITNEEGNVSPMLYPEIFYSLPFQIKIIDEKMNFSAFDEPMSYADYILSKKGFNPFTYFRNFVSSFFNNNNNINNTSNVLGISKERYGVIKNLINDIKIDLNSKEGSIYISATMHDPVVAAQMALNAQKILQNFVIDFKIKKAKDELNYLNERVLENEKNFKKIQNKIAQYKDENQNFSSELAQTKLKFLESEYDLAYKIYSDLSTQLESKKLQVKENTPLFTTLKPANIPNEKSNLSRLSLLVISIILGFIISIFIVFYSESIQNLKNIFNQNS